MDRLIALHRSHQDKDVAPEVEAAWFHHRFAQIHPFTDGNGRVARALATLVFIRAGWLPLVVRDNRRGDYISALEKADGGDLKPLVTFFAALQRQEFVKALSIARDVERSARVDTRIKAIGRRLARRRDALEQEWAAALSSARRLHRFARDRLSEVQALLQDLPLDSEFTFFVDDAADGAERSHYFRRQIVSTARGAALLREHESLSVLGAIGVQGWESEHHTDCVSQRRARVSRGPGGFGYLVPACPNW